MPRRKTPQPPKQAIVLKVALSDPKHPQHKDMRDWVGPHYDPDRFDPWMANQNLILAAAWGRI